MRRGTYQHHSQLEIHLIRLVLYTDDKTSFRAAVAFWGGKRRWDGRLSRCVAESDPRGEATM